MKKRAAEIFHGEVLKMLAATSKSEFAGPLTKIAQLADIFDQSGDEVTADRLDELLKQAGFWSALLSGLAGGGGAAVWDAFKAGKLKEGLTEIVKKALMAGTAAVVVDYMIKWLDGLPLIGGLLKELENADKLRSILEGVVGGAVAESDLANKLVDKAIDAIEGLIGIGGHAKKDEAPKPAATQNVVPGAK